MHLVLRENLPESNDDDHKQKHKHDNNQIRTDDHIQHSTPSHRSDAASPNSATTGCCERCVIL